jgi:hypothetical protein
VGFEALFEEGRAVQTVACRPLCIGARKGGSATGEEQGGREGEGMDEHTHDRKPIAFPANGKAAGLRGGLDWRGQRLRGTQAQR